MSTPVWVPLMLIELVPLAFFTLWLLRFYASKTVPTYALAMVFISWYLGFFGTLFLPIDIAEAYGSRVWAPPANETVSGRPWNGTMSSTASFTATPSRSSTMSLSSSITMTPTSSRTFGASATRTPSASGTPTSSRSRGSTRSNTPSVSFSSSRSHAAFAVSASASKIPTEWRRRLANGNRPSGGILGAILALFSDGIEARELSGRSSADANPNITVTASPSNPPPPAGNGTSIFVAPGLFEGTERSGPLESMWFAVYWLTAIMTYVVVPIVQEYYAAGDFTPRARLCTSVQVNITFYAVVGSFAFCALTYVVLVEGATIDALQPVLISLANTMGLVIIVLLLGFGAAEVPKELWRSASPASELSALYFSAAEFEGGLFDARQDLGDDVTALKRFSEKLAAMSTDKEVVNGPLASKVTALQKAFEIVDRKIEAAKGLLGSAFQVTDASRSAAAERIKKREAVAPEEDEDEKGFFGGFKGIFKGANAKYKGVSIAKLAALHKSVMSKMAAVHKAQHRWESLVLRAMELEYVVSRVFPPVPQKKVTEDGKTYYLTPKEVRGTNKMLSLASGIAAPPGINPEINDVLSDVAGRHMLRLMCIPNSCGGACNRMSWRFKMWWKPSVFKLLAALTEVLSILLIWSESTIWLNLTGLVTSNLSVFGLLLSAVDDGSGHEYFFILTGAC